MDEPEVEWRTEYDRGTRLKPGQNQQGSGTTPSLFDDFDGRKFVAIADNADPFLHVNIYNRLDGSLVASQEVFSDLPFLNSCENSLIVNNHSIIIENNYGNVNLDSTSGPKTTVPGVERVDFNPVTGDSWIAWSNKGISIPSVVTQLSTADGLIYTYAKDEIGWYWAALDFDTGIRVDRQHVVFGGPEGIFANNFLRRYRY